MLEKAFRPTISLRDRLQQTGKVDGQGRVSAFGPRQRTPTFTWHYVRTAGIIPLMLTPRQRPLLWAVAALAVMWALATAGYLAAKNQRVTAEKVRVYLRSVDLSKLSGEARTKALRDLARQLNALSFEERRAARLDGEWARWFEAMTEEEKSQFIDATVPTGVKNALTSFEQLPPERRRRAIDEALKRLKEAQTELANGELQPPPEWATNPPPIIGEELRQKLVTTGLKSFYSDSSAQTKAELAPLLEELQRMMERGAFLRGR